MSIRTVVVCEAQVPFVEGGAEITKVINGEERAIKDSKLSGSDKKEGDDFMAQLRMGKSFLHGTDKDGRPCCYVRVKLHKQGEQSEKSLERFTVYTIETTRMMLKPPVDTAVSVHTL